MTAATITTSAQAYELAQKLVWEYEGRKKKERDMALRKEGQAKKEVKKEEQAAAKPDPSRMVTEIDYAKHERVAKELERQEKEEALERKKQEARPPVGGCSHDHQKEWAIYEKSTEEKLKAADRFREEGNEAYRKHNYGLAAVHYRKALLQFDYTFPEGEEEEKQVDAVKVPCLLNLAACKCQQEQWDEVLTNCRLALEINPRSVKAYYRTGLAHLARDNFEEAKDALMSAHEIEPKNAEVLGALKRLKDNMANYKVRRKEVFREMVSGTAEEDGEAAEAASGSPADAAKPLSESSPVDEAAAEAPSPSASSSTAAAPVAGAPAAAAAAEDNAAPQRRQGPDVGAAAAAAPPPAEAALGAAAAAAPSDAGSGLRQRRPPVEQVARDEDEDDGDAEGDEVLSPVQRRLLNRLLLGAAVLGVTAVAVCAAAAVLAAGDGAAAA